VETFESKKKKMAAESPKQKLLFFTHADDVEAESRISAHFIDDTENESLTFGYHSSSANSGRTWYADGLRKLVWEANKAGKEELVVKDACYEDAKHKCSVTLTALVDLKEQYCYAFKVDIKTTTSSSTEYFVIP